MSLQVFTRKNLKIHNVVSVLEPSLQLQLLCHQVFAFNIHLKNASREIAKAKKVIVRFIHSNVSPGNVIKTWVLNTFIYIALQTGCSTLISQTPGLMGFKMCLYIFKS